MPDDPITITGGRLATLEKRVDDIHGSVAEIASSVGELRAIAEKTARESTEFRRLTKADLHCITTTWQGYLPMFEAMRERQEERKQRLEKVKTQVVGWSVVAALGGVGSLIYHWVVKAIRVINGDGQ